MTFEKISDDLRAGRTTSVALVETALEKARAAPHVFLKLLVDEAMAAARAADDRRAAGRPLGPLDGIAIGWKDLVDIAGTRTTAGSIVRADAPLAESDAPVVAATRQVGLIPLGKTNLNEFAFSGIGYNPHFGTPYAGRTGGEGRAPGGSSSGTAIAVERGIVPAAVGSDTGGSVRIPAALNGLVGYKSSRARYPLRGVFPLGKSLDSLGPIARTVADCIWLDAAMRGIAAPTVGPTRPEAVVFDALILEEDGFEDVVRSNTLAMVDQFRDAGVPVEIKKLAAFDAARRIMREVGWLGGYEAYELHRETVAANGDRMDPRVVARLGAAANFPRETLVKLRELQAGLQNEVVRELGGALFLSPTVRRVAPLLAPLLLDNKVFATTNLDVLLLTMPGSYLDMPGVSLPSGTDGDGHPTGILLSAGVGSDDAVLGAALWVEQHVLRA